MLTPKTPTAPPACRCATKLSSTHKVNCKTFKFMLTTKQKQKTKKKQKIFTTKAESKLEPNKASSCNNNKNSKQYF